MHLVEPPLGGSTTDGEVIKVEEGCVGQIYGVASAAHAFVNDDGGSGLSGCGTLDCDGLAAVRVSV